MEIKKKICINNNNNNKNAVCINNYSFADGREVGRKLLSFKISAEITKTDSE